MELVDHPGPGEPGPGEVIVRNQAVGICGSDFHFLHGELDADFPRIQGHEVGAVVEAVGPDCERAPGAGDRVAHPPDQLVRPLLPVPDRARQRRATTSA